MRKLGLSIATLVVTAATGCQMDIPFRAKPRPPAKTEQTGGVASEDSTSASPASDEMSSPKRFSRDGVSNAQMFPREAPVGYRDTPTP